MKATQFSVKISIFNGRKTPEEGTLVGYGAIIQAFQLEMPYPSCLSLVSDKRREYKTEEWNVYSSKAEIKDTLYKHLVFAIKNEGVNLLFFKKLFDQLTQEEVLTLLQIEPQGLYSRKVWFLYEWLLDKQLPMADLNVGNYVTLLDETKQYSIDNGDRSSRHRVVNNLPGTRNFCPLINKTVKLEQYIASDLVKQNKNYLNEIHKDILTRTSAFLLLKDSKASFTIEGEKPLSSRAARWGKAIGQAGMTDLTKEELIRLQQVVIENTRFVEMGFRLKGGFVGEHDRLTGTPIPSHISAKWQDLETLIDGLLKTNDLLLKNNIDSVLSATLISFGFVFIHPFEDGNGRIHRYLIHHLLAKKQFGQQGIIFPVSASILNHIDDYRRALEAYSQPLLDLIQWNETSKHNVEVINDTIDYYRYFDATKQAEFLYDCVKDTIENIIPQEIDYLIKYDQLKQYLDEQYEMPDKMVALLIRFLEQNNGQLSKRAIENEFSILTTAEIKDIEHEYRTIFQTNDNQNI